MLIAEEGSALSALCIFYVSSPQTQTVNQAEQETCCPQKAITNLKTELHKIQMENDALSDLRWKHRYSSTYIK